MKIVGYGICGPGEAGRYLRRTLEEFARLCDEVVILCNNTTPAEDAMIDEFGFKRVRDTREWGKWQWKIKQELLEQTVSKIAEPGDMMVCLDMDEHFDRHLTREWILGAELDAYHVFVVDLWNDPEHYKPESCFWNVRIWRWNGDTKFKAKPVHCGLAPEWAYRYHRFAPFLLLHYGLMAKEDRVRKIARYEKYDPDAQHLDRKYYRMLRSDDAAPFDVEAVHGTIASEVATYQQTKPRNPVSKTPKIRYAYVQTPHGTTVDIPEGRGLDETLKRPGFTMIGWADDTAEEMAALFDGVEVGEEPSPFDPTPGHAAGSYQRSQASEAAEVAALNREDVPLFAPDGPETAVSEEVEPPVAQEPQRPVRAATAKKAAARKSSTRAR